MGDVVISKPRAEDEREFLASTAASRQLHGSYVDAPKTPASFSAYLARSEQPSMACFLIRHEECGGLVGFANLSEIVRGRLQSAYLGYAAFSSHAGRGLMREGLSLVIAEAFGPLGLHRLEANIQPSNEASKAIAGRLGFRKEGLSPGYLFVDGEWRDHERWALLSSVWRPPTE